MITVNTVDSVVGKLVEEAKVLTRSLQTALEAAKECGQDAPDKQIMTSRLNYSSATEDAVNQQITVELTASQHYLSASAYFGRTDVALEGLRRFFRKASDEEREHAMMLIDYQNRRGGKVEFGVMKREPVWSSAMQSLQTALEMERYVSECLLRLHGVCESEGDPELASFLEENFLPEQVRGMAELEQMMVRLRRAGTDGLGLYLFDLELQKTE